MYRNFRDHAANERTFLAWVRTSIAIMALGFVVERFTLFLRIAAASTHVPVAPGHGQFIGTVLIVIGALMIVLATARFLLHKREIDRERVVSGTGRAELLLALLLALSGLFLAFFVGHPLLAH